MVDKTRNQLVADIAHDMIAETVPQELALFSLTSETYFQNPDKMRQSQKGKDEMLGFGVDAATVALLSPIILTIVDEAIKVITGEVIPEHIKKSGIVRKLFKRDRPVREENKQVELPQSLTPDQLQKVQEQAISSALQFKISREQAELLANVLVGKLALANN
jgi:hypothetical protein